MRSTACLMKCPREFTSCLTVAKKKEGVIAVVVVVVCCILGVLDAVDDRPVQTTRCCRSSCSWPAGTHGGSQRWPRSGCPPRDEARRRRPPFHCLHVLPSRPGASLDLGTGLLCAPPPPTTGQTKCTSSSSCIQRLLWKGPRGDCKEAKDFTPSRGTTPNFQTGTPIKPQLNRGLSFEGFPDTKSEPSPRKKLAEFFQESSSEPAAQESNIDEGKVQVNEIAKETNTRQNPISLDGTPCPSQTDSIGSTERVPKSGTPNGRERAVKAMQCCLPNLVHSHFHERKKQAPIPEPHIGG